MGQKIWHHWRHGPRAAIFQNSGGLGGVACKDRARLPPCGRAGRRWAALKLYAPMCSLMLRRSPNPLLLATRPRGSIARGPDHWLMTFHPPSATEILLRPMSKWTLTSFHPRLRGFQKAKAILC